jgi:predicted MFS family arabinose efflux permease
MDLQRHSIRAHMAPGPLTETSAQRFIRTEVLTSNAPVSFAADPASHASGPLAGTGHSWLAVMSVALSAVVFCTTEFLPIGLLRYISAEMRVSEGTAGLMVSAPGLLAALAAPLVAIGVGRLDRRTVLLGLSALLIISNLVSILATSFPALLAGRVLFGIGLGGFWSVGAGIGGRLVAARSVGRATSLIFGGVSLGMLLGGSGGALVGDLLGSHVAFAGVLALSVAAFLVQARWLPSLPVAQRVPARDLLGIVATPAGRVGLLAMLLVLCGQFAAYTYITPFLAREARFDARAISAILLGYTLIGLVGNFLGGLVPALHVKRTLAATMALFFVSVLLLPAVLLLGAAQAWTLALIAAWGLAYGAMPLALQMWMAKAASDTLEGGMALYVANFQVSIALGAWVGGVVVDRIGLFTAMGLGGLLGVAGFTLICAFNTGTPAVLPQR